MMSWIRSWGITLFAVLALVWVFSVDWLIKRTITSYGTQLNGAQVELESADFSLWPAGLELINLRITDAYNPMFNRFEAASINATLDSGRLLRRQVIIQELDIVEVRVNSSRTYSGATGDTYPTVNPGFDFSGLVPDVSLPDMDILLADAEQQIKSEITGIEKDIEIIEQRWRNNIEQLPSKDKVSEYRARWEKLSSASFMEKMLGAKKLKDEVSNDLKVIKSFNKQLKNDRAFISEQITRIKELPSAQVDRMMEGRGLSDENIAFVRSITGEQIDQWVNRARSVSESLSGEAAEIAPKRGQGRWVTFPEDNSLPKFLIRHGEFSGKLQLAGSNMQVAGTLFNIAYPLEDSSQPASLTVTAKDDGNASLLLEAVLDHGEIDFNDRFNLEIVNLPFSEVSLSKGTKESLMLKTATLNVMASGTVSDSTVSTNVVAKLSDPTLKADSAGATQSEQWVAETLNLLDSVDLQVDVSGALNDPTVHITSNLDKILAAGLKSQVSTQTNKFKKQFTDQLGQNTTNQLNGLSAKGDFLKDIQALLNDRKAAMPGF